MVTAGPPPLTILQPGEGAVGDLGTIGVAFKFWGRDTNGQVSVVEHPFPVGALVPPHLHTREDEYSIVTREKSAFDLEIVRPYSAPAGTSPSRVGRCTRCGTQATRLRA
jgi:hypothetical protein